MLLPGFVLEFESVVSTPLLICSYDLGFTRQSNKEAAVPDKYKEAVVTRKVWKFFWKLVDHLFNMCGKHDG